MTDSAGLTGLTAAVYVDFNVECFYIVCQNQWLANDHTACFTRNIFIKRTAVDNDNTGTALHENTGYGALTASCTIIVNTNHL